MRTIFLRYIIYHIYKDIWTVGIGEERNCERVLGNHHDLFAVAIMKDSQVVGHVPCLISRTCTLFIRHGGSILATVTKTLHVSWIG